MAIYYLEVDDEITTAVAKLRSSEDPWIALALPAGSRVATSRINFRLLAREAQNHARHLAVLSPETSVRAIAIAAGLPAYSTVAAYEDALETERMERDGRSAGKRLPAASAARPGSSGSGTSGTTGRATGAAGVAGTALGDGRAATGQQHPGRGDAAAAAGVDGPGHATGVLTSRSAGALPVVKSERRERRDGGRRLLALVLALVAVLALAGGTAAYLVLPAAEITVTPVAQSSGPASLTVTADPGASSVSAQDAVVPAQSVTIPLSAHGTFPATGVHVDQTRAAGTVTFSSNDTIDPVTIPAGTTVSTPGGVQFLTTATVVTPRATVSGTSITPGEVDAPVQAADAGTGGNVPAHAIIVAPQRLQNFLVSVDNAQPADGGTRTETKVVSSDDFATALKALSGQLDDGMRAALSDPQGVPAGMTVFPQTAQRGSATVKPARDDVVGATQDSFDLTATATATVTAVDKTQVATLAEDHLRTLVPPGFQLMADGITTTVGDATVNGSRVVFQVQASAEWWKPVDAGALLADVKGKKVSDARAILASYGDVDIRTWPGYVDSVPTLDGRATLTVAAPRRASQ